MPIEMLDALQLSNEEWKIPRARTLRGLGLRFPEVARADLLVGGSLTTRPRARKELSAGIGIVIRLVFYFVNVWISQALLEG
jgi:hypothetical protein